MITQTELLIEAKSLADQGKEYGVIVGKLDPEEKMRLKAYVLNMEENLARKTIYGMVTWNSRTNTPKGRGRPKK